MALDSTWWATGYAAVKITPDFAGATVNSATLSGLSGFDWRLVEISDFGLVVLSGGNDESNDLPSSTTPSSDLPVHHGDSETGYAYSYAAGAPGYGQYRQLLGLGADAGYRLSRKTKSIRAHALTYYGLMTTPYASKIWIGWGKAGSVVSNRRLYVVQPHAWLGTVASVIGSILRSRGVPRLMVDEQSFSDADTAQQQYGAGSDKAIKVFYRREPMQRIADALMALTRHSWDFLTLTMDGRLAMISRKSPGSRSVSGLTRDDGVILASSQRTLDHVANSAYVGFGRWTVSDPHWQVYHPGTVGFWDYKAIQPASLVDVAYSVVGEDLWEFFWNQTSAQKYGSRWLENMSVAIYNGGLRSTTPAYHMPYLAADTPEDITGELEEMRELFMSRLDVDAWPRREITVHQDMLGANYDVGWRVQNVEVTHDGATVADTRCVYKKIDFNRMAIESVLLEEPAAQQ